jgi:hypothetical protein
MSIIDQLIQYQNFGGIFAFTNFTVYTDGYGECLININKDKAALSAAGRAYELLWKLNISQPVKIENGVSDNNIMLQAAWNENKTQFTILAENFDSREHICSFDISGLKTKFRSNQTLYKVWADNPKAFNSPKDQNAIKSTQEPVKLSTSNFRLVLPGNGVWAIVFEK